MSMEEKMKNKLAIAREKLKQRVTLERIRKIPKYKGIKMEQYLRLLERLELLAMILIESQMYTPKNAP